MPPWPHPSPRQGYHGCPPPTSLPAQDSQLWHVPSGHLCLLTIVGLVLPTRGEILEMTTSVPPVEPNSMDIHTSTQVLDMAHPELPSTPHLNPRGWRNNREPGRSKPTNDMENRFFSDKDTLQKQGLLVRAMLLSTGCKGGSCKLSQQALTLFTRWEP
ncbi:FXYD domain-containing ion transport regulator 5-like [Dasypus novemcinctus]|uniref:FXYD domain-containing ion transport regulator 5-like n=1 Tax=Dasypus novemcinctus TaxID=9361 RepID=UPI0039C9C4B2